MLDSASSTLSPLPDVLSKGLVAVSTFGLLSFFCSSTLFLYLTWKLISWRIKNGTKKPLNQFLLLIYNLLLADIQQALAFLLNISALRNNAILVGTSTCWAQGWFISTGDLASSVFICVIAIHTFFGVVKDYRLPTWAFYTIIAFAWAFVYVLGAIGPIIHGSDFYVRASAWCWINAQYSHERLWLHYFWIFFAMALTILLYTLIYIYLHHHSSSPSKSLIHGATPLMILYPLIYTICTAPLAAGRIFALAGHDVSLGYFCMAGTMIACNGWLDVLLYASTRADIVFSDEEPGSDAGLGTFGWLGRGGRNADRLGTVTVIEGGLAGGGGGHERVGSRLGMGRNSRGSRGGESVENLYMGPGGMGMRIGIKENVQVSVESSTELVEGVGMKGRNGSRSDGSWDGRSGKSGKSFEMGRGDRLA